MSNPVNSKKRGRINVVLNHKRVDTFNQNDSLFQSEQEKEEHEILSKFV